MYVVNVNMNLFNNFIITSLSIITAVNVLITSTALQQSEDFQRHVIKMTVKPIGPAAFNVEWKLLPDVNASIYYLLTYFTQHTNDVKFTSSNNLTLTELIECTAYTIIVRCSYGVNENMFGSFASSSALTSHNSQLKTVKNLTVETSKHSILIAWENPDEQKLCTANYHISLDSTMRGVTKEIQTESDHYLMTALEPCVTYYGYVSAVDFAGINGNPVPFNVTTDSGIPGPVLKLSAISNDSKSIFVSWEPPINSSFCVHQYEVVYCYDNMVVCSTILTPLNSLTISKLKSCITYQITVTPKMADNVSGVSAKTKVTIIAGVLGRPINGRVLYLTNFTVTLQWDPPVNSACKLIHQTVNCSYLNSSLEVITYKPNQLILENLIPSTKYVCSSAFLNKEGYSTTSDEIIFWTKMTVPDPPTNLSIIKLSANRVVLSWAAPTTILSAAIDGYRWTVTFKKFIYEVPKHCAPQTEDRVTHFMKNDQAYQYEIKDLRPASYYNIELSASTESGFGNSTNITIQTFSSTSSPVENLNVTSIKSNLVVLSWKYPCIPNGKIAFFHSTFLGERIGYHNHIFSIRYDISENETEFEYTITNLMAEYKYICTVVAITYNVDIAGQDKRIQFVTPSTSPKRPSRNETLRRLQVTVSKSHLTQVRLSISRDLFSGSNGNIQYYSIIVYQDGGFPDNPERCNRNFHDDWPPVMRKWAEASPYPFILAYQTTPDQWMPFKDQEDAVYNIGADESCLTNYEKIYCNGPLRPVTNYRLKVRAFTTNGFQDSWSVSFTTPGEFTAVYYLVLYSVLFAVLITVTGLYCILNEKVPWAVKYRTVHTTESGLAADMSFKQLLHKTPQDIEAEYNLLNILCSESCPSAHVAMMPENKFKNRYINTLPYDYNRVIIKSDDNDYINASFIEDFRGNRQYIACQGPMKNTCIDMWQMILDHDVASIVMLCQTSEKDKVKCEKYFPNSKEVLVFGDIQVKNDIMIIDKEYPFITRILTILKGNIKKTIRHFQFLDWPDFGIPSDPSVLVKFCQVVQAKSPVGLVVIHCSAGVGRTGTYIACDMLLRLIQERTKLSVLKTVLKLREQRINMVQTQAQYEFVYGFLVYNLKHYLHMKSMDADEKNHNTSANGTDTAKLIQA